MPVFLKPRPKSERRVNASLNLVQTMKMTLNMYRSGIVQRIGTWQDLLRDDVLGLVLDLHDLGREGALLELQRSLLELAVEHRRLDRNL